MPDSETWHHVQGQASSHAQLCSLGTMDRLTDVQLHAYTRQAGLLRQVWIDLYGAGIH